VLFSRLEDAQRDLQGNLIEFKGEYIYIRDIYPDGRQWIMTYKPIKQMGKNSEYSEFDFRTHRFKCPQVRLGLMNTDDEGVFYLSRTPQRITQFGLNTRNFTVDSNGGSRFPDFTQMLGLKTFQNMLYNQYPSLEECLSRPNGGAFSRHFRVEPIALTTYGLFKGLHEQIGEVSKSHELLLYPDSHFLLEPIQKILGDKYEISKAN